MMVKTMVFKRIMGVANGSAAISDDINADNDEIAKQFGVKVKQYV